MVAMASMWLVACESEDSSDLSLTSVPVARGADDQIQPPQAMPPGQGDPAALPQGHPPIGAMGGAGSMPGGPPMGAMGGTQGFDPGPPMDVGGFGWAAPATWAEVPPASQMRLVQWQVGAENTAGAAECSILRFRGGGTTQENLARWASQYNQPDGGSSLEAAMIESSVVNELAVTTFEVSGTMLSRGMSMAGPTTEVADSAMHSAVVETPEGPYFLKCTGPQATIAAGRASISELIQSFHVAE